MNIMSFPLNLTLVGPEILMLTMAVFCLLMDLSKRFASWVYPAALFAFLGSMILTLAEFSPGHVVGFSGHFVVDPLSSVMKIFILFSLFFLFIYSRKHLQRYHATHRLGECLSLALFSTLGMMVLVSAGSLLTVYLGVEIMSFPIYAMIALDQKHSTSIEAAVKYFVIGALASGMMLYGFSILFGLTDTLTLSNLAQHVRHLPVDAFVVSVFALVLIVVGIGFKIGLVPFHMWLPDTYTGATSMMTLFISTAPKVAAMGLLVRLLVQGVPHLYLQWQAILMVLALLSVVLGNVTALSQANIKRMLAYSAIAHAGYMVLGFATATAEGISAALFYVLVCLLMSLLAFGLLVLVEQDAPCELIDDLKGLHIRSPFLAGLMLLVMFSMIGVPPLAGFFAKMAIIASLLHAHFASVAIFSLLLSVVGAFYYIRVVRVRYFESPKAAEPIALPLDARLALVFNGGLLLLLGIFPAGLFNLCQAMLAYL